jgi:hypothetical protein
MKNFDFKKFLTENKLTVTSKMLSEVEFVIDGNHKIVVPDNLKVRVIDYDEATDKDVDTGKTVGAVELKKGIEELTTIHGPYYRQDLKAGLEYTTYYPNQDKPDYMMMFKFKQVGDKLEVDSNSVRAEIPASAKD